MRTKYPFTIRTKYPPEMLVVHNTPGTNSPYVNNASTLQNNSYQTNISILNGVLCKSRQSIDKIQFSLDTKCLAYCLERLKKLYPLTKPPSRYNTKQVWHFNLGSSLLQVVQYTGESTAWFQLVLQDPTKQSQIALKGLFSDLKMTCNLVSNQISVSQIEFALDFYPLQRTEQNVIKIGQFLSSHVTMKHAQKGSCSQYKETDTHYIGTSGNTRRGSKGLKIYPKPINMPYRFCRLELNLNKPYLRDKVDIDSLPLSETFVNVTDFIKMYRPLTKQSANKAIKTILKFRNLAKGHAVKAKIRKALQLAKVQDQIDVIKQMIESSANHKHRFSRETYFDLIF